MQIPGKASHEIDAVIRKSAMRNCIFVVPKEQDLQAMENRFEYIILLLERIYFTRVLYNTHKYLSAQNSLRPEKNKWYILIFLLEALKIKPFTLSFDEFYSS